MSYRSIILEKKIAKFLREIYFFLARLVYTIGVCCAHCMLRVSDGNRAAAQSGSSDPQNCNDWVILTYVRNTSNNNSTNSVNKYSNNVNRSNSSGNNIDDDDDDDDDNDDDNYNGHSVEMQIYADSSYVFA